MDIHGQGEQRTLFSPANHLEILDEYGSFEMERSDIADKFRKMTEVQNELESLREDETQKLQLIDVLKFQIDEISRGSIETG